MTDKPLTNVWVEIEIKGEFPDEAELAARNEIIDRLTEMGIGEPEGAGGGMGMMDFSFHVADEEAATQTITEVVRERLPGVEFGIDTEPVGASENGDSDGGAGCAGMVLLLISGTICAVAELIRFVSG